MAYRIRTAKKFRGRWQAAGDKSITHRAFLFNALAEGEAKIENANGGEDCGRSRELAAALGAEIEALSKNAWRLRGCAGRFEAIGETFDAGNSGTTLRLAAGLLAGQPFAATLDGDASLRRRPMARIAEPLAVLGAEIDLAEGDRPPLTLRGLPEGGLRGGTYESPLASAQVKSAFLLAALQAAGESSYREPLLSRDHSERMLTRMGAEIQRDEGDPCRLSLTGPQALRAVDVTVPGDISSAAFLIAAALLVEGGNVLIKNLGVNPSRTGILDVLERMGARIALYHPRESAGEPVADLLVQHSLLQGTRVAAGEIPRLVDEVPVLAAMAMLAKGETRIEGLAELRVKESDRLTRSAELVTAFGGQARIDGDCLILAGGDSPRGCEFRAGGDHRLAMAASVLALVSRGETLVGETESVATSFPEFPSLLRRFSDGALAQEQEREQEAEAG